MTKRFNKYLLVEYLRYTFATPANLLTVSGFNMSLFFSGGLYFLNRADLALRVWFIYAAVLIIYCVGAYYYWRKYKRFGKHD